MKRKPGLPRIFEHTQSHTFDSLRGPAARPPRPTHAHITTKTMAAAAASDALAPAPASRTAALSAAVGRAKAAAAGLASSARPWAELADRSAFAKPTDLAEVRVG